MAVLHVFERIGAIMDKRRIAEQKNIQVFFNFSIETFCNHKTN